MNSYLHYIKLLYRKYRDYFEVTCQCAGSAKGGGIYRIENEP